MKLFEAKDYVYEDANLDKPVRYTEEFLKEIAEKYPNCVLQSVHDGQGVGVINNIHFKDGWLMGDLPSDIKLDGKGLSPLFQPYLLDKGDYYEAVDGELKHIAIADNPRNQLLYNEIKKGEKMSDDVTEMLTNRVQQLEREVAVKDNQLESNKKKLEEYEELKKEVKSLKEANSNYESKIEANSDKANKWDEYITSKKASLIDEVAGDDSTMKEKIKDWSIDQLNFLKEHKNITTEPKGIGNGNAEGLGEVESAEEIEEASKPSAEKFLELYHDKFGEAPTFITKEE